MKLQGKLHRITNLQTFIPSWIKTGGKPTEGFTNWGTARVHLVTDLPSGVFTGGFIPSMSLHADANNQGEFSFNTTGISANFRGQIVAFRSTTVTVQVPGAPPVSLPVFDPVYRSDIFKFSDVSPQEQAAFQHIYIFESTTPNEVGISQNLLDAELATLRVRLNLDSLKASILSDRISVQASKSGGDIKFDAFVRGSTSEDITRVIEVTAGDIDIDLPGPDFIVGLCVDKDQIEAQIRVGLAGLSKDISRRLIAELERLAPGASATATISVWRTRFAQTGTKTINIPRVPPIQIPIRSIVPDAAFAVPKKLY